MSKDKIIIILTGIKERFLTDLFSPKTVSIALSVWILSLTAYYCINTPWLGFFSSMRPDTKQLIGETLNFQWIPVFLSRLPYVFYALILNFIALLMGNRILRWLKVDFDSNLNRIIFSIPLGWGIYSIGIFYLGISGLLYKEAVYCFLTLLGILSILEIRRIYNITSPQSPPSQGGDKGDVIDNNNSLSRFKLDKTDLVFLPILIIFIAIQLVISFSPVWSNDALVYHMALPKLYIKHHALVYVPGFFFSTLPAHTEMLYLLGLITSGETLSKLFSFSISSMFLIFIFSVGNRYFSKGTGYLATIIMMQAGHFFSLNFSEPWVDAALGLFSLLGIYAFFMWMEDRGRVSEAGSQGSTPLLSPPSQGGGGVEVGVSKLKTKDGYLYLSITCCALAAATKIQGLFFVLLFFASFLITVRMDRQFLKKLAWCILAVCIIALPWYIRSWWLTGNPVFPFLYNYFGGKYWNEYSNACFWEYHFSHGSGGAKSFSDFIRINKNLFFFGFIVSPLSPIIVIFLIPALIAFRNWNKLIRYLFLATLAYYIFFIFTAPVIRYFYVGLAILSIIAAHFIKTVWTKFSLTRVPILCIVIFSIVSFFGVWGNVWKGLFFAGLGVLDRRQFLNEKHHDEYLREYSRVAMWANDNLPQDSKILTWHLYGYYLDRQYLSLNPIFQGVLDFGKINDTPTFLKNIKELDITHLLCRNSGSFVFNKHVKEFLEKGVSELLESGKIVQLKQIGGSVIYSLVETPDYFVLNNNTIRFWDGSQRKHLARGWASTEGWGTWSEGKESLIIVNFKGLNETIEHDDEILRSAQNDKRARDYTMLINATGFSVPGKQQSVKIYLDDYLLGEHTFIHPTTYFEDIEVKIPSAYIKEGNQQIKFVYSFTGSPAEHGMGPDVRQLAMGVSSIEFK